MGYDEDRFVTPPPNMMICTICTDVVERPIGCPNGHLFCGECIEEWLKTNRSCPVDRHVLTTRMLKPVEKMLMSVIMALGIKCVNYKKGCDFVSSIDDQDAHAADCNAQANSEQYMEDDEELVKLRELIKAKKEKRNKNESPENQPQQSGCPMGPAAPTKEINILILAETGVGKSTFINSFANYITCPTLDEAINTARFIGIVPSSFTVIADGDDEFDDTYVQKKIIVGEKNDNEDTTDGASATQATTPYVFTLGQTLIRLIDTPGIGDTRGADKDSENMENILHTINNYDHLHGILILLKPNSARLTVMFRFVIQELLTHLHRDAAKNIVFGFTNTRGTNYRPGDTFPALMKLLKKQQSEGVDIKLTKKTTYCFDSESFRYLAALKNGIELGNREDYARSWDRSVDETFRMLYHINSLIPHPITSTASLNAARKLITDLTIPMADISRNISVNIQLNLDENARLADSKAKGRKLEQELMVSRIDLEMHKLEQPVTVCGNSACIEVYTNSDGNQVTNYKQRCHNPCYLDNVRVDTLNTSELTGCAAMSNGNCRICSHNYTEHMHVLYDHREVKRQVEDASIRLLLNGTWSDRDKREAAIAIREQLIEDYRNEQSQIDIAGAKFGFYLKHNSITPYNDARVQYIEHQIKQEENKLHVLSGKALSQADRDARHKTEELIESLKSTMSTYREYDRMLDEAMTKGDASVSNEKPLTGPKDIKLEVEKLYKLKYFGKQLEDAKKRVVHKHCEVRREVTYQAPHVQRKKQSRWDGLLSFF